MHGEIGTPRSRLPAKPSGTLLPELRRRGARERLPLRLGAGRLCQPEALGESDFYPPPIIVSEFLLFRASMVKLPGGHQQKRIVTLPGRVTSITLPTLPHRWRERLRRGRVGSRSRRGGGPDDWGMGCPKVCHLPSLEAIAPAPRLGGEEENPRVKGNPESETSTRIYNARNGEAPGCYQFIRCEYYFNRWRKNPVASAATRIPLCADAQVPPFPSG